MKVFSPFSLFLAAFVPMSLSSNTSVCSSCSGSSTDSISSGRQRSAASDEDCSTTSSAATILRWCAEGHCSRQVRDSRLRSDHSSSSSGSSISSRSSSHGFSRDESSEVSSSGMPESSSVRDHSRRCDCCCWNCHRLATSAAQPLQCRIVLVPDGKFRKKFCTMDAASQEAVEDRIRKVRLCRDCETYLCHTKSNQERKIRDASWPSLMWMWLTDQRLRGRFGFRLWRLVPLQFRDWWESNLADEYGCRMGQLQTNELRPLYKIVTRETEELLAAIDNGEVGELVKAVRSHIMPLVRCPWGCTEFLHRTGRGLFDEVTAAASGSVTFACVSAKAAQRVDRLQGGIVPSYLDMNSNWEHLLLGNPDWKVMPSLLWTSGSAPVVLTCRDHHCGNTGKRVPRGRYIHPPTDPLYCLPAKIPDQVAPVTVRPRCLHTTKAHEYSDTYEMSKMKGSFSGVDTFDIGTRRNLGHRCELLREREILSAAGRQSQLNFITSLANDGLIPDDMVRDLTETSPSCGEITSIREVHCRSANTVPVIDAVALQRSLKLDQKAVVNVPDGAGRADIHYDQLWPSSNLMCHPAGLYGARPHTVPSILVDGAVRSNCLSAAVAMHVCVPEIWESTVKHVQTKEGWEGWLLKLASCEIGMQPKYVHRNNPFVYEKSWKREDKLLNLADKLHCQTGLASMCRLMFAQRSDVQVAHISSTIRLPLPVTVLINSNNSSVELLMDVAAQSNRCCRFVWGDGKVWTRHGRGMNPGFWVQDLFHQYTASDPTIPGFTQTADVSAQNWEFAILVKEDSLDVDDIRDGLLSSIGGQGYIRCAEHNEPLIASPGATRELVLDGDNLVWRNKDDPPPPGAICCEGRGTPAACRKRSHIQCRQKQCPVGLCLTHFRKSHMDGPRVWVSRMGTASPSADGNSPL